VAGLTLAAATAIKYQANFDDMLAVARPHSGKKSELPSHKKKESK
jgi:hypothetical protein